MNPCDLFRRQTYLALDGELPPVQAVEYDAHRASCPPCDDYHRLEAEFGRLLQASLQPEALPPGIDDRLLKTVARERRRRLLRAAGLGAAALLMMGAVSFATTRWVGGARPLRGEPLTAAEAHGLAAEPVRMSLPRDLPAEPVATFFRGELVCPQCVLATRHRRATHCLSEGHKGALLLPTGEIIYFSDDSGDGVRHPAGPQIGQRIEVWGDYHPREKMLAVRAVERLPS